EKIALILVGIQALQQVGVAVLVQSAGVVAGGDQVAAQHGRILKKDFELDFPVTEDVRIGCAPGFVFRQKMLKHIVPVLSGEVGGVQPDTQAVAYPLGIGQVGLGGAVLGAV